MIVGRSKSHGAGAYCTFVLVHGGICLNIDILKISLLVAKQQVGEEDDHHHGPQAQGGVGHHQEHGQGHHRH